MVCPICISTAIYSSIPVISSVGAASAAGYIAAKFINQKKVLVGKVGHFDKGQITFNKIKNKNTK